MPVELGYLQKSANLGELRQKLNSPTGKAQALVS